MSRVLNLRYTVKSARVISLHNCLNNSFRGSCRLFGFSNKNYVVISRITSSYFTVHCLPPLGVQNLIIEDLKTEGNKYGIGRRILLASGLALMLYECSQHMKGKEQSQKKRKITN